jgi:hypothetical protein
MFLLSLGVLWGREKTINPRSRMTDDENNFA